MNGLRGDRGHLVFITSVGVDSDVAVRNLRSFFLLRGNLDGYVGYWRYMALNVSQFFQIFPERNCS